MCVVVCMHVHITIGPDLREAAIGELIGRAHQIDLTWHHLYHQLGAYGCRPSNVSRHLMPIPRVASCVAPTAFNSIHKQLDRGESVTAVLAVSVEPVKLFTLDTYARHRAALICATDGVQTIQHNSNKVTRGCCTTEGAMAAQAPFSCPSAPARREPPCLPTSPLTNPNCVCVCVC